MTSTYFAYFLLEIDIDFDKKKTPQISFWRTHRTKNILSLALADPCMLESYISFTQMYLIYAMPLKTQVPNSIRESISSKDFLF